jgi:hypothetical protein
MLIDKRTGLFHVTLQANGILVGYAPHLRIREPTVLVVAIGALDQFFINPMMEGLGEVGFDFGMASVTQLRLRLHQQVLRFFVMMRRVAIQAIHVVALVGGAQKVAVLLSVLMAGEAGGADLIRRGGLERDDFRGIAARLHMRLARAVAGFALPYGSRGIALIKCNLPVGRGGKVFVEFRVAVFAALRADIARQQFGGRRRLLLSQQAAGADTSRGKKTGNFAPERGPWACHDWCSTRYQQTLRGENIFKVQTFNKSLTKQCSRFDA